MLTTLTGYRVRSPRARELLIGLLSVWIGTSVAQAPRATPPKKPAMQSGTAGASAPALESGAPAISYLKRLDSKRRLAYLRAQLARLPAGSLKTRALEEVLWTEPTGAAAEFAQLRASDANNPTVQIFAVSRHVGRMLGRPDVEVAPGEITSVTDVIDRWKQATGYAQLLNQSVVLSRTSSQLFGREFPTETFCVTDGTNTRTENIYEDYYVAAKGPALQIYNSAQSTNITTGTMNASVDLHAAMLGSCLNLSNAVQAPVNYEFHGLKSFMGAPAYALGNIHDGSEEFFDSRTFFHLGTLGAEGSFSRSFFGYRDFGGTVLPQFSIFHQGNRIELKKIEAVQWDAAPVVSGDLYQLKAGEVSPHYFTVLPLLFHSVTRDQFTTEQVRATQEAAAVSVDPSYQYGLDSGEQAKRRAYLQTVIAQLPAVAQASEQWEAIGHAVVGTIEQHERARRFANPTSAADLYYNWRDVTNVSWLMHRTSIQVKKKSATSGQNSTLSYCALDNQGNMRNEDAGSIEIDNRHGSGNFTEGSSAGTTLAFPETVKAAALMRRALQICLLGDTITLYDQLAQSRFGTGTFNKRAAYVIVVGDNQDGQYYFFDKETFLLIGKQSGANDQTPESFYDFRKTGEAILPFKQYTYENDAHTADTIESLESMEYDLSVSDSEFSLNPPVVRALHSLTLSEQRPSLVARAQEPSVFGAILTGTLMGLAGGSANSPILQAGNRQAEQIRELGNELAARQGQTGRAAATLQSMSMPKFSAPPGLVGMAGPGTFFDPGLQSANLAQLQSLLGLTQANQTGNGSDSELVQVLQQLTAQTAQTAQSTPRAVLPTLASAGTGSGAAAGAPAPVSAVVAEQCPHEEYPDMGAHCNPVKSLLQCVQVGSSDWSAPADPSLVAWLTVHFTNTCSQTIRLVVSSGDPAAPEGNLLNLEPRGAFTFVNQQHSNRYKYSADDGIDCSVNNARPGCTVSN